MTTLEVDDTIIREIRVNVALELARRSRAAEAGGGQRLTLDDERVLTRQLVNGALELLARDAIAANRAVLNDAAEQAIAQVLPISTLAQTDTNSST